MSFSVIQARSSQDHAHINFALMPIYSLGHRGFDEQFDRTQLPFQIVENVYIEDVSKSVSEGAFDGWSSLLGKRSLDELKSLQHAFVHRYEQQSQDPATANANVYQRMGSKELLSLISACLHIIRPMRQGVLAFARGEVREADRTLDFHGFELTKTQPMVEVVEAYKLSTLRNKDAEELRQLIPEFIRAMKGEFWKFRMAVQFYESGYFQSSDWKPRFLLWCSALESLFTSQNRDHQGSRVAIERIKWFLGVNTRIYPPGDWPRVIPDCPLVVGDILDNLYKMRNCIAHGDKLPDSFFNTYPRRGVNGNVTLFEVLSEAASFIIRKCLFKILRDGLLDHFIGAAQAEAYFAAQGLTNSQMNVNP